MFQEMLQVGSGGGAKTFNDVVTDIITTSETYSRIKCDCGFKPKYCCVMYKSTSAGLIFAEYDNGQEMLSYARNDTGSSAFRNQSGGLFTLSDNGFVFTNANIDENWGSYCIAIG